MRCLWVIFVLLVATSVEAAPFCSPEHRAFVLFEFRHDGWAEVRIILNSSEFLPTSGELTPDQVRARRDRAEVSLQSFLDSLPSTEVRGARKLPELNSIVLEVTRAGFDLLLRDARIAGIGANAIAE